MSAPYLFDGNVPRLAGSSPRRSRLLRALQVAWFDDALDVATLDALAEIPDTDLGALNRVLSNAGPRRVRLTGTLDRRLLFAERRIGGWILADLSGGAHATRSWPAWTADRITIAHPDRWISAAQLSTDAVDRLDRPRTLLTSLYHPEVFPLPRFQLAISDLARAARSSLLGEVHLIDMQLGASLDDIIEWVREHQPDIVGVSATFGQHDLLNGLLTRLYSMPTPPLVLAGGSLTVRNEATLLQQHPQLLIARGAGESTIVDAMAHFHGDCARAGIRGISYTGEANRLQRTAVQPNRLQADFLPELDLLDATFDCHGVTQLEISRGCTSHCSFCPRGHKGAWTEANDTDIRWMLNEIGIVADRHPSAARTLYLVDEEFIGQGDDPVQRALDTASTIKDAGFTWESSCRIDQVAMPLRDREWHVQRGAMWRRLVELGLRRMLFGVESGVDSILDRFVKDTTGEQNARAIRTLSALGVPTRFTYITFDHLMTAAELAATTDFQARTDLLLRPLPHLSVEEIIDGVTDEVFVAEHSAGRPFYTDISYMLVSMECLVGAPYTRVVQARGLAGRPDPSLGRVEASFADWRIGICARRAQMWIDRHFALDYTLKSLEKISDDVTARRMRAVRVVIKDASFRVLTGMLGLIAAHVADRSDDALDDAAVDLLDAELAGLAFELDGAVAGLAPILTPDTRALLERDYGRWRRVQDWSLINATDPCGT